jgi:hypothetical protein
MTEYVVPFASLAFALLIVGDLSLGSRTKFLRARSAFLAAYWSLFWGSFLGYLLLPACAALKACEASTSTAARVFLSLTALFSLCVAYGLFNVHSGQIRELRDFELHERIHEIVDGLEDLHRRAPTAP